MKIKLEQCGFELYQLSNHTLVLRPRKSSSLNIAGNGNKYGPQIPNALNQQQWHIKHVHNLQNIQQQQQQQQQMPQFPAQNVNMAPVLNGPQLPPQEMPNLNILNTYARQNDIPYDFYANYGLCLIVCKNYQILEQNQAKIVPMMGNYFNYCFCFVEQSNLIQFINKYPASIKKQVYGIISSNDVEQTDVIVILYDRDKKLLLSGQSIEHLMAFMSQK